MDLYWLFLVMATGARVVNLRSHPLDLQPKRPGLFVSDQQTHLLNRIGLERWAIRQ